MTGDVVLSNNANVTFDQTSAGTSTYSSIGSGAGSLTKTGIGTIQFNMAQTYTGATTLSNGGILIPITNALPVTTALTIASGATLSLGANQTVASLAGAGQVNFVTNTLTIGGNNASTTFSGDLQGAIGSVLNKNGTGTFTFTGGGLFSGNVNVNAGTLVANGSMGNVNVASGATLMGGGSTGIVNLSSGSTIAPGNSIGTLTVNGNITFAAGTTYQVEANAAGQSDKIVVVSGGNAIINGGTVQVLAVNGSYNPSTVYPIITANSVTGTFTGVTSNLAFLTASLQYTPTEVDLVLTVNNAPPPGPGPGPGPGPSLFSSVAQTFNQKAVAGALDQGSLTNPIAAVLLGQTVQGALQAFDALSGEAHASTQGVLVDESQYARSAILGRLRQASYGGNTQMASLTMGGPQAFAGDEELNTALAYGKSPIVTKAPIAARPEYDTTFWAQGFGARGRFDGDGNATNVRRDLAGFFSGVDTRVADGRIGIAAGYTGSRNNLDGRGSSNVETGHIAGYGGWSFGAFNLRAGGDFAFHQIDTSRNIVFPGFFDTATASYKGRTGQVFGEAGYGFAMGNTAVEPFAGGAWVHLNTDGFTERALIAGLNGAANSFEVGYSNVGIRAAAMIPLANDMMLVPRGSVAWQHAFNSVTPDARLALIAVPVPFVVAGTPIARDAILGEAGLDLAFGRSATIGVSYTGQLARNVQDHAAKGKFSWKF